MIIIEWQFAYFLLVQFIVLGFYLFFNLKNEAIFYFILYFLTFMFYLDQRLVDYAIQKCSVFWTPAAFFDFFSHAHATLFCVALTIT